MTDQEVKDEAAKRRIVTHMNEDHHDSITRYLEHYYGLSSSKAHDGVMTDVNLNGMVLVSRGITYRLSFNPPLSSYRETRERVVEMDNKCREGLGKSDITVKDFIPPTDSALYLTEFLIIVSTFLAYSQRWWFVQGSIVERVLGSGFARFSWTIQPALITFMVCLHGAEAIYFARNHLYKHSVSLQRAVYWKWVATTFIEGQFAFKRFNDHVAEKQRVKEKQKH